MVATLVTSLPWVRAKIFSQQTGSPSMYDARDIHRQPFFMNKMCFSIPWISTLGGKLPGLSPAMPACYKSIYSKKKNQFPYVNLRLLHFYLVKFALCWFWSNLSSYNRPLFYSCLVWCLVPWLAPQKPWQLTGIGCLLSKEAMAVVSLSSQRSFFYKKKKKRKGCCYYEEATVRNKHKDWLFYIWPHTDRDMQNNLTFPGGLQMSELAGLIFYRTIQKEFQRMAWTKPR